MKTSSKCIWLYFYSEPSIPDIEQEQDVEESGEVVDGVSTGNRTPPAEGADGATTSSPTGDEAEGASTEGKAKKGMISSIYNLDII